MKAIRDRTSKLSSRKEHNGRFHKAPTLCDLRTAYAVRLELEKRFYNSEKK